MKDPKTKQQLIELRAAGYSFDKIAKKLMVAKSTLIDWSKEFEFEVANLKAGTFSICSITSDYTKIFNYPWR